jgi:hypothetical protein
MNEHWRSQFTFEVEEKGEKFSGYGHLNLHLREILLRDEGE